MKSMHDDKRLLIKKPSSFPGDFPERPEVSIPEVFHGNEASRRIVADQPRNRDIVVMEKFGNIGVVSIFKTLRVIMDQDGRIFVVPFQSEKSPV